MIRILIFIFILAALYTNRPLSAQLIPIDKAWAKNSINAVIFRKNSVVSYSNMQYVAFYDSLGYIVLAKRNLDSDDWQIEKTNYKGNVKDAHNSISIMVDGDGYLHMAWDHHNSVLNYCKSTESGSLTLTQRIKMTGILEDKVSYPEFYRLPNGNLLFFYRDGSSGNGNLVINKYNRTTKEWNRLHDKLIDGKGKRNAYWQACVDAQGTVHVSWVWRETPDVASNHDICYAKSTDGGITWLKSNDKEYRIPITAASAEYACNIPKESNLINQTSMYADSFGNPYIASYWSSPSDDIPQYRLLFLENSKWKTIPASSRKTDFILDSQGTLKIPVSRPQLLIDNDGSSITAYLIYRDEERNNRVSMNVCTDLKTGKWQEHDLTLWSVESWEPTYDTELWKSSKEIHLYVMSAGQGDNETLENVPAQMVYIMQFSKADLEKFFH